MDKQNLLLTAAVAGLMGAAITPAMAAKKAKSASKDVPCYGVNKCKGMSKCSGPGHDCAGQNSCKGQGWLPMPKDSCLAIEGGSLTAPAPQK